jgi:hypothetical protein
MRTACRLLIPLALTVMAAGTALAQAAPPIKPGLWKMHIAHEGAGAPAMPDVSAHLKNLPPAQRQRIEAMMKAHGVDASSGPGNIKVCMNKDSLDTGAWQGDRGHCKTDVTDRSTSRWKWHSACTEPQAVSDGEAVFANDENYTIRNATTVTTGGQPHTTHMTITANWLGADCGDVKPIHPATPK